MKKVKYTLDLSKLKLSPQQLADATSNKTFFKDIFENNFTGSLSRKYKEGLSGPQRGSAARILEALDESTGDFILVENAEFDLLKIAFGDDVSVPSEILRVFSQYEKNIGEAEQV